MMSAIGHTPTRSAEPAAPSVFRETTVSDQPRLTEFLARAFAMETTAPFLEPALVRWKFWEPRGDFAAPRSYVLERGGRILGHVGLWPASIDAPHGPLTAIQMIDWASDASSPGAGASLVQRLLRMYSVIYSIGGSDATRKVLPRLGFREVAAVWIAARPLRPFARRPGERFGPRSVARMARNFWWSRVAAPAAAPPDSTGRAMPRGDEFFRYLARCPVASLGLHDMVHAGERRGRVALTMAHGQARVAGVWLDRPSPDGLARAYQAAQRLARDAGAPEITAMGASPGSEAAARAAGFRVRERRPVYLYQKAGIDLGGPIEFQIVDDDACFRYESPFT